MQALGSAEDRGQRLDRGPDDVVVDRLGGQARPGGLDVEPAQQRLGVRRPEPLAHDRRPHPAGGPELGDLLEQLRPGREEEGQAPGEVVDVEAPLDGRLDVGDGVGQGEGQLLRGGRAGLAHVVAADRDRVPARQLAGAELEDVGHEAHRGARREDVGAAGDVLLEDVVLGRAGDPLARRRPGPRPRRRTAPAGSARSR